MTEFVKSKFMDCLDPVCCFLHEKYGVKQIIRYKETADSPVEKLQIMAARATSQLDMTQTQLLRYDSHLASNIRIFLSPAALQKVLKVL